MTAQDICADSAHDIYIHIYKSHDKVTSGHPQRKDQAALRVTHGCNSVSESMPMGTDKTDPTETKLILNFSSRL